MADVEVWSNGVRLDIEVRSVQIATPNVVIRTSRFSDPPPAARPLYVATPANDVGDPLALPRVLHTKVVCGEERGRRAYRGR